MDESEFVVVDEDRKESAGFDNLAEVVQAYGAARDSLLKGVTLLHDTLNLNMELALKNTPPDFESNSDDLMKRILGSLHTSSEAVLRNHVKSLCSKLVAVKKEYEDLENKLESLNMRGLPEPSSKFAHLADVLDQIDALLPPSGDTPAAGSSTTVPAFNVEGLCARAESIRDRVKLVMEARLRPAFGQSEQRDRKDFEANSSEQSRFPLPKAELSMDISRMIREEVTSVFQAEMGVILERQRDLIQQALKPPAEANHTVGHVQRPPDEFYETAKGDKSHSASSSLRPAKTSSQMEPYLNETAVVEEPRERSTRPPLQSSNDASISVTQPMLLPVPPRLLIKRFVPPVPIVCPQLLPSGLMPPSPKQSGLSQRQKPSFLPNDEEPVCPKCQMWLPDRGALEIHLDTCLQ